MELRDTALSDFTQLIASPAPAPGGGGAVAAAAAAGIALGNMVGQLTVGKKKYKDVEEDIIVLMDRSEKLRLRFLELTDEDGQNFKPLAAAYKIPKDQPGRTEELERCLKLASKAPLEIFDLCCEALEIQKEFAEKGSKLAVSDAATGAVLLKGALYGAAVNVKVNTHMMKDLSYAEKLEGHVDMQLSVYSALADEVFQLVYSSF